jgi:hypothetical protein
LPNGHHVVRKQRLVQHDSFAQVRRFDFRFEERDRAGKTVRDRLVPLSMRYSFRDELEIRLREVGFGPGLRRQRIRWHRRDGVCGATRDRRLTGLAADDDRIVLGRRKEQIRLLGHDGTLLRENAQRERP